MTVKIEIFKITYPNWLGLSFSFDLWPYYFTNKCLKMTCDLHSQTRLNFCCYFWESHLDRLTLESGLDDSSCKHKHSVTRDITISHIFSWT